MTGLDSQPQSYIFLPSCTTGAYYD